MADIYERIRNLRANLPTPLAKQLDEIARPSGPDASGHAALMLAESLAQALALIGLSEASQHVRPPQLALSADLLMNLRRPSNGHWQQLLRETLKSCPDAFAPFQISLDAQSLPPDSVTDYVELWKRLKTPLPKGGLSVQGRLGNLLTVRNARLHTNNWSWDVPFLHVASAIVGAVLEILEGLHGLWRWTIVSPKQFTPKKAVWTVSCRLYRGPSPDWKDVVVDPTGLSTGEVYLWDGASSFRRLWPFARALGDAELAWLSTIDQGIPTYSTQTSDFDSDDAESAATSLCELVPALRQTVATKRSDPLRELVLAFAHDDTIGPEEFAALVLLVERSPGLADTPSQARDVARAAIEKYAPKAKLAPGIISTLAAPRSAVPVVTAQPETLAVATPLNKKLDKPLFLAAAAKLGLAPAALAAELSAIHQAALVADWSASYEALGDASRGGTSAEDSAPTERLAYGTFGVQLARPWRPALFVGVIFSGHDHNVSASSGSLGADFAVVVDTHKPALGAWPGADIACRQPEFERLRARLRDDSGGWDFHDHLAVSSPNVWHPIHLRRPLATVFAGAATAAERRQAWLEAARSALDVVLRGGELAELRRRYADVSTTPGSNNEALGPPGHAGATPADAVGDGNDAGGVGVRSMLVRALSSLERVRPIRELAEELVKSVADELNEGLEQGRTPGANVPPVDEADEPREPDGRGARSALLTALARLEGGQALRTIAEEILVATEKESNLEIDYRPRSALVLGRPPGSEVLVRLFYLTHQGTVWAYLPYIEKGGLETGAPSERVRAAIELISGTLREVGAGDGKQPTFPLVRLRGREEGFVERMLSVLALLAPGGYTPVESAVEPDDDARPTLDQLGEMCGVDLDDDYDAVVEFLAWFCSYDGTRGFRKRMNASPNEKLSKLFADRWDNADLLGTQNVARIRDASVDTVPTIARLHGVAEARLREAIGSVHGRTLIRNVLSGLSPE